LLPETAPGTWGVCVAVKPSRRSELKGLVESMVANQGPSETGLVESMVANQGPSETGFLGSTRYEVSASRTC